MFLKPSKRSFEFSSVKSFGYKVSNGKYKIDEERTSVIKASKMSTTVKQMQFLLGAAMYLSLLWRGFQTCPDYLKNEDHILQMEPECFEEGLRKSF